MSYALYRKGFTHRVDGVECEIARVELNQLEEYRAEGWVDDVADIDKELEDDPSQEAVDKIITAIELLEPQNPEHFTEKGSPKLEAVRAILGDEAADKKGLNAAWKLFSTKE